MRLNKQTGDAIRILIDCARAGDELVKVSDVAQRLGLSRQNTFKIVHLLSRAGFVAGIRGPNGGIRLAKPAGKIRVGDVVVAMEETSVEAAGSGAAETPSGAVALNAIFDDALAAFISVLHAHTLADLAAAHRLAPARAPVIPAAGPGKRRSTRAN